MGSYTSEDYNVSGRDRVPLDRLSAYVKRAEIYLIAITGKTLEKAVTLGYEREYKEAISAVVDVLYVEDQQEGKDSESVGNYSVKYDKRQTENYRLYQAAKLYLSNTGLLYRGMTK